MIKTISGVFTLYFVENFQERLLWQRCRNVSVWGTRSTAERVCTWTTDWKWDSILRCGTFSFCSIPCGCCAFCGFLGSSHDFLYSTSDSFPFQRNDLAVCPIPHHFTRARATYPASIRVLSISRISYFPYFTHVSEPL